MTEPIQEVETIMAKLFLRLPTSEYNRVYEAVHVLLQHGSRDTAIRLVDAVFEVAER